MRPPRAPKFDELLEQSPESADQSSPDAEAAARATAPAATSR